MRNLLSTTRDSRTPAVGVSNGSKCVHNVGVESKSAKITCVIFSSSFELWMTNYRERTWKSGQWHPGQYWMPEISFTLKGSNLIPTTNWKGLSVTCKNTRGFCYHRGVPEFSFGLTKRAHLSDWLGFSTQASDESSVLVIVFSIPCSIYVGTG